MASTSIPTVPSSFTSAFPQPQPEYDVFLSFRGEDTRYTFTDHLYHALVGKEIITFKDDKELKRGEPISQKLLDAIEKSRIAVIIISKNYASSTWCLEELAKIVECKDRGILTVLPIFYHVEPTDVRYQKKTFAKAFAEYEKCFQENPEKVQKWRAALTNVANISGDCLKAGVHEAIFIQSFVEWLYLTLKEKRSNDIEDDLVGISFRVEKIVRLLDINPLRQRYVMDQNHQMESFCHVLPQIEIPEWFKYQNFGSFGTIPLPRSLTSNRKWKGFVLCVIFEVRAYCSEYFPEFYCRLHINGDLFTFKVRKETYAGSFGLWLYISHARYERSCINPFIGTYSEGIEIKMCGARILYEQDMGEFLQNLGKQIGSPNDLRGELK